MGRVTTATLMEMKARGEKMTMLTAYDYRRPSCWTRPVSTCCWWVIRWATWCWATRTPLPVTMDEMIHHTRAVARGTRQAMVVGDMPFLSYQASLTEAVLNAGRFLKEGGAQAVKLEGGSERASVVRALVETGIPVMGHLASPLSRCTNSGVSGCRGRTRRQPTPSWIAPWPWRRRDLRPGAGGRSSGTGGEVTSRLQAPTIGIGTGPDCDGQVLVVHDMLGLSVRRVPKFVRQYASLGNLVKEAARVPTRLM